MTIERALIGTADGSASDVDPNFENVSLLLHGDGTNGAQNNTFLDSSTNNFTITRNGNTTQGSFSPYGDLWSNYFDGSGDSLTLSGGVTNAGTGDFCLELWTFFTGSYGTYTTIWDSRTSGGTDGFSLNLDTSGNWVFGFTVLDLNTSTKIAQNQWQHVCATRQSGTIRLFVNGVLAGTLSSSNNLTNTTNRIGQNWNNTYYYTGYVSNLRAEKTSVPAAYQTSSTTVGASIFTPPTAPLTAISGTSLLTCQSNRFKDNSSNNFAITVNGNTSVQPFSPFNPTAAYSPTVNGGSGYFDGTGDYVTAPYSSAFVYGSSDFTVELWCYANGLQNANLFYSNFATYTSVGIAYENASIRPLFGNGPASWALYPVVGSGAALPNQWNHIAFVRSGSTFTLYINGIGYSVGTYAGAAYDYGGATAIGSNVISTYFNGYISNNRVVKGTAVYTSNFTPPTAPLTAITNTSLLCNFTNAGIFDNAMKNDLETVGNAQISTSVKKYGTGSLAFDGTGDYLYKGAANYTTNFGTGSFTIEAWVYPTATGLQCICDTRLTDGSSTGLYFGLYTSNQLLLFTNGTVTSGGTVSTNTWSHVAVVKNSTTITLYINGSSVATVSNSANLTDGNCQIGASTTVSSSSANYWYGYIDDLRITKGVARYTANFTPPTAAFPNQ